MGQQISVRKVILFFMGVIKEQVKLPEAAMEYKYSKIFQPQSDKLWQHLWVSWKLQL